VPGSFVNVAFSQTTKNIFLCCLNEMIVIYIFTAFKKILGFILLLIHQTGEIKNLSEICIVALQA
jgi:hypothetical protein